MKRPIQAYLVSSSWLSSSQFQDTHIVSKLCQISSRDNQDRKRHGYPYITSTYLLHFNGMGRGPSGDTEVITYGAVFILGSLSARLSMMSVVSITKGTPTTSGSRDQEAT